MLLSQSNVILLSVFNMYLFVTGGLLLRGITEIVGESAAGKTQLCLQLCLSVQLPIKHGGLNGGELSISQWLQRLVIMFISVFHRYNGHIFTHTHADTHTETHHTMPNGHTFACIAICMHPLVHPSYYMNPITHLCYDTVSYT